MLSLKSRLSFLSFVLLSFSAAAFAQAPEIGEMPEIIELTEKDVEGFIVVAEKLQALGLDLEDDGFGSNPTMIDSLLANNEVQSILRAEGLEEDRLSKIGYSVALAYAAANQSPEEVAELQAGIAQMEQMQASMPAEQWAMIKESMGGAYAMMEQFMDQPDGNMALAKQYGDELKALFGEL